MDMIRVLVFLLLILNASSRAQNPVHISFDQLPEGTVLGEQFAASGVHFVRTGGAVITSDPGYPNSPGNRVGNFMSGSGSLQIICDRPVSYISMRAADDGTGIIHVWSLKLFESPSPASRYETWNFTPSGKAWASVGNRPTGWAFQLISFENLPLLSGGSDFPIYFSDIEITFIPEPTEVSLLILGGLLIALGFKNRAHINGKLKAAPFPERPCSSS